MYPPEPAFLTIRKWRFVANLFLLLQPLPALASEESKERCRIIEMKSLTPFYIARFGEANLNQFGIEWNNWYGVHPSEKDCSPINGYGYRVLANSKGGTLSPYFNTSYNEIFGLSVGPELGPYKSQIDLALSLRLWAPLIGIENRYSMNEGFTLGVYLYLPFHQAMIQ